MAGKKGMRHAGSEAVDEKIRAAIATGATATQAAEQLGCSVSAVAWRLRAMQDGAAWCARAKANREPVITAFGESRRWSEWARDPRVHVETLARYTSRTRGMNWSPEDALTRTPKIQVRGPYKAFGESKSLADWARDPRCAVTYATLGDRMRAGSMSLEEAITTPPDYLMGRPAAAAKRRARGDLTRARIAELVEAGAPTMASIADALGLVPPSLYWHLNQMPDREAIREQIAANRARRQAPKLPARDPRPRSEQARRRAEARHPIVTALRRRRVQLNMTVPELAGKLGPGWTEARITACEIGRNGMSLAGADETARALGLELRLLQPHGPGIDGEVTVRPLIPGRRAEVLACLGLGMNAEKTAEQLEVSRHTVREYMKYIYEDLGAHTSGQAVALGVARGWIVIEAKSQVAVAGE